MAPPSLASDFRKSMYFRFYAERSAGTRTTITGTTTIPFTRSYLPGKSQFHIAAVIGLVLVLPLTISAARFERDALQDGVVYSEMMAALAVMWTLLRYRTAWLESTDGSQVEFDGKPADRPLTLEVWDSRF